MSESYILYHYDSCPFCQRVRRFMAEIGIELPLKNILQDREAREELMVGGGRTTVPCLRIQRGEEVQWLYESLDIMSYLKPS